MYGKPIRGRLSNSLPSLSVVLYRDDERRDQNSKDGKPGVETHRMP